MPSIPFFTVIKGNGKVEAHTLLKSDAEAIARSWPDSEVREADYGINLAINTERFGPLAVVSALDLANLAAKVDSAIDQLLAGRKAIVRSNYNGQSFGRSAKPWTGREVTIAFAFADTNSAGKPRVTVWLVEQRVGGGAAALGLDELEVL